MPGLERVRRGGPCGHPGWCFWCYRNRKHGPEYVGHWGLRTARRLKPKEIVLPIEQPSADGAIVVSSDMRECAILIECPTVLEWLTLGKYSNGKPRETSTLTIFIEGHYLKMALNDRQERRGLYLAGESIQGILTAMEAILASGNVPWKYWPNKTKK